MGELISKRRLKLFVRLGILLIIMIMVGFTIYQVMQDKKSLDLGEVAPNFVLKDIKGQKVELKDFQGEGVLLNFWASWCDACKKEMPYINKAYQANIKGVNILEVDIRESPAVVKKFVEQYQLDIPIVFDREGKVTDAYTVGLIPTTFLIDKNGRVVKKIVGPMKSTKDVITKLKIVQP